MADTATKNTIYFLIFAVTIYILAGMSACNRQSKSVPTAAGTTNEISTRDHRLKHRSVGTIFIPSLKVETK